MYKKILFAKCSIRIEQYISINLDHQTWKVRCFDTIIFDIIL